MIQTTLCLAVILPTSSSKSLKLGKLAVPVEVGFSNFKTAWLKYFKLELAFYCIPVKKMVALSLTNSEIKVVLPILRRPSMTANSNSPES